MFYFYGPQRDENMLGCTIENNIDHYFYIYN